MTETKVRLSIVIPGRTLLSEQECSKNPKENYTYSKMSVNKDEKGKSKITIHIAERKCKTAKQNIQLSKEAYDYMIGTGSATVKGWKSFSKNQKVNYHCSKIAEALGGISYHFEILDE